jgi:nitroreductase
LSIFLPEAAEILKDLIRKNRSTRKYYQDFIINLETLKELVDLGRLSASGGNHQPLKYILSCEPDKNAIIFSNIGLSGQPKEGERPSAYIIILRDTELGGYVNTQVDHAIAAQSILLGAVEMGLSGCMVGKINRKELQQALHIPEHYEILLTVTLGKPRETIVIDIMEPDEKRLMGWWDEKGIHHLPKRKLEDIIIG